MRVKHCPTACAYGFSWILSGVLFVFMAVTGNAQTFTSLASFNVTDGKTPEPPLVQGLDGNFYGITSYGGRFKSPNCGSGCGTVFRVTPDGTLTTFYAFCSQTNCPDGFRPTALVLATDGNFYGTTWGGGSPACSNFGSGCGTFFKLTANGTLTTLYSFCASTCADGALATGLVQASDGNFYGTTEVGGAHGTNFGGTIFRVSPSGILTTLYSFCALANCADGDEPNELVQATNGRLYGTTGYGGANSVLNRYGDGTIFSITMSGQFTKLHDFCSQPNCADGSFPQVPLIQAANGMLYGTTWSGGLIKGFGTIFKLTPGGAFTNVYRFCSETNCLDGANPNALLQATDGDLYGTTSYGGVKTSYCHNFGILGCGTIFRIVSSGALSTLYTFCSELRCADGNEPDVLMQSTDGSFYGTTATGGLTGFGPGTVFGLSVDLGPFVQTVPTSGKVGTEVTVLGTNLTGTTGVSFHGTEATFTVVSATQITTTVPAGATTGAVTVTTPSGTLKSNVVFRVP